MSKSSSTSKENRSTQPELPLVQASVAPGTFYDLVRGVARDLETGEEHELDVTTWGNMMARASVEIEKKLTRGEVTARNPEKLEDMFRGDFEKYVYTDLATFAMEARAIAESKKQFVTQETVASALMFVVTEISEAANAIRRGQFSQFELELADAMIFLAHIASSLKVNLVRAVMQKMRVNATRPEHHDYVLSLGKNLKDVV